MISLKTPACQWGALILLNAVCLTGIFYCSNPESVQHSLHDIQAQLTQLQHEIHRPQEKMDLTPINQDFNKLAVLIEQLKHKDENQLNQLMIENRAELTQKLNAIHEVMKDLHQKQNPVKQLSATALPFKILSIDSIQQVSVVSVVYDFKTIPLEKGDMLAGWKILTIDFGKQHLVLENMQQEQVVITLDQGENHV